MPNITVRRLGRVERTASKFVYWLFSVLHIHGICPHCEARALGGHLVVENGDRYWFASCLKCQYQFKFRDGQLVQTIDPAHPEFIAFVEED